MLSLEAAVAKQLLLLLVGDHPALLQRGRGVAAAQHGCMRKGGHGLALPARRGQRWQREVHAGCIAPRQISLQARMKAKRQYANC